MEPQEQIEVKFESILALMKSLIDFIVDTSNFEYRLNIQQNPLKEMGDFSCLCLKKTIL